MRHLLKIWRFGVAYLRRYWFRFALGVTLGIVFGLINATFIWASKTITSRMKPATGEVSVVAANPVGTGGFAARLATLKASLEERTRLLVDPWLPQVGRPIRPGQIAGALLLLPLLVAARGYIGYASSYCMAWVSERVVHDLRMDVIAKLFSMSVDYFNRAKMGDLLTRLTGDTAVLQRTLSLVFSDLVKEPFTMLSLFLGLVILDWKLSLFIFLFLPVCALPMIILGRKMRRAAKGNVTASISQTSLLVEAMSGIRVVKAYGLEAEQTRRFNQFSRSLIHHNMKSAQARELVNPTIETISMLGLSGLVVAVFVTGTSVADLVGFIVGVALFFPSVKKLGSVHIFLQHSSVAVDRLTALFAEQPQIAEPATPARPGTFERGLALENVSFAYTDQPVLRELSVEIPRGCKLGVVGESGSGKSTLINLLLRFHDPTAGAVRFDGVDLRQMPSDHLRGFMALVSQEVVIFDLSVADNIACGRKGATRAEIESAARAAFAHEFITQLPRGYDTPLGERGVTLSGGQRQRIAIARAFVRDAPILLLDEATAALDSNAEAEVQKAIERLERDRTVVCIAHRLSTLADMDRIIVLADGRIVEEGTFAELLARNGVFAGMAARQGLGG